MATTPNSVKMADVEGTIVHQTTLAYLFDNGDKRVWIPKSQCQWDPDDSKMTMLEKVAIEKGLV